MNKNQQGLFFTGVSPTRKFMIGKNSRENTSLNKFSDYLEELREEDTQSYANHFTMPISKVLEDDEFDQCDYKNEAAYKIAGSDSRINRIHNEQVQSERIQYKHPQMQQKELSARNKCDKKNENMGVLTHLELVSLSGSESQDLDQDEFKKVMRLSPFEL